MADDRVIITIDINADTSAIDRVQRKLRALAAEAELADAKMRGLNSSLDDNAESTDRVGKANTNTAKAVRSHGDDQDRFQNRLKKTSKELSQAEKGAKLLEKGIGTGLKFAMIGAGIEMVAMGAALATVNGLLGLGSMAMKVYKYAMGGVAYAAAAAVVALSTVAAAQREYNASLVAFQYKSSPALGKGTAQAMSSMRNLAADTRMGVFGMKNLNAAFAAVSKNAEMTGPMQNALAGLGDFAVAAGGDIGKNIQAAGDFLGLLRKEGSLTADVMTSAGKVGPQFEKAITEAKKKGLTSADQIISALSSGDLAKESGLEGALQGVNNTLIGQLKSFMTQMQTQFGDLGQKFLPDVKVAFDEVTSILRVAFIRISGAMGTFSSGKLLDNIVKATEKISDFVVSLFVKWLPQTGKLLDPFVKAWDFVTKFFATTKKELEGLSKGGKVITDTFGPVLLAVIKNLETSLDTLSGLAVDNEDKFKAFGEALATAFTSVQNLFNAFKVAVVANLPVITTLFNGLAKIIDVISAGLNGLFGLLGKLGSVGGGLSSALAIGAVLMGKGALNAFAGKQTLAAGAYNRVKEKVLPGQAKGKAFGTSTQLMNVSATTVNVNGTRGGGGGGGGGNPLKPGGGSPNMPVDRNYRRPGQGMFLNEKGWAINDKGIYAPQSVGDRLRGSKMGQLGSSGLEKLKGSKLAANAGNIGAVVGQLGFASAANENAAPFIAAGSAVSMINPMAGLAVSGLGAAATAKTGAGGAVAGTIGGAAAGMAAGAAFGSVAPGIGTAIGAAAGLAFGYTMGKWNADKAARGAEKKNAKNVGMEANMKFTQDLFKYGPQQASRTLDLMKGQIEDITNLEKDYSKTGNVNSTLAERRAKAEKDLAEGRITQAGYDAVTKDHMGTYMKELRKQGEILDKVGTQSLGEFTRKTSELSTITGKSKQEISDLAMKMGVDLTDGSMTLSDALKALGESTVKTTADIKASVAENYAKNVESIFGTRIKKEEALQAIDQSANQLKQLGNGNVSQNQMDTFMQTLYTQALGMFGGDAFKASQFVQSNVGSAAGAQFNDPTGPLYGMQDTFEKLGVFADTQTMLANALRDTVKGGTSAFTTGLTTNSQVGMSQDQVNKLEAAVTAAMKTDPTKGQAMLDIMNRIATEGITDPFGNKVTGENAAVMIEQELSRAGVNIDLAGQEAADKNAASVQTALGDAALKMKESISQAINTKPNWWDTQPTWWNNGKITVNGSVPMNNRRPGGEDRDGDPTTPGDTTTARLGRTLARHGFYDSMLSGSRSITSSLRNSNLGSINSDHATGAAYDLTGQNLGAYSSLVNKSGGFAEFHGSGGDRHLHVVPGQTPIGDTMSPVAAPGVAVAGSSSYSIVINAQAGQDEAAIAQEVMRRIEEKERSSRERQ